MAKHTAKKEDKRIQKTKKCLKRALLDLLVEKPFEKIKVTEICDLACTGRVTFYTYYDDKYSLLKDCFEDIRQETTDRYQEKISRESDADTRSFRVCMLDFIDALLETSEEYNQQGHNLLESPDLMFMYFNFSKDSLEEFERSLSSKYESKYDTLQLNSFFILGFYGFIHARPDMEYRELCRQCHDLASDLLDSPIFKTKQA